MKSWKLLHLMLMTAAVFLPSSLPGQNRRRVLAEDESEYGSKFFEQLKGIFGRFRNDDLQRVFQQAKPIQCSELAGRKGEWRPVAFFNEDRKLGDWCRESLDEVRGDLSVYTFKGECRTDQSSVQISTEFPIASSMEAYNQGTIPFEQVDINVNDPVTASFNPRTMAYTFDLPYLFQIERRGTNYLYSFIAPNRDSAYASNVSSRWECKAVSSQDVTYRFLICRTSTIPSGASARGRSYEPSFGASAFFILSDGTEAQTSVSLSFSTGNQPPANPSEPVAPPEPEPSTAKVPRPALSRASRPREGTAWHAPAAGSKLAEVGIGDFRLRFNSQTWAGKIGSPQLLSGQKLSVLPANETPQGVNSCVWQPGKPQIAARLLYVPPAEDILFSLETSGGSGRAPSTIVFDVRTRGGDQLGKLQCQFPKAGSPGEIAVDQWNAIVGIHLTLETR